MEVPFKQYLFRECPVQRGWFEWGPDEKKNQHIRQKKIFKKMVQLSITKLPVREAQLGLDLKCLFIPNANFLISCSEEAYRVPDLGSAEPEGTLLLSCPS